MRWRSHLIWLRIRIRTALAFKEVQNVINRVRTFVSWPYLDFCKLQERIQCDINELQFSTSFGCFGKYWQFFGKDYGISTSFDQLGYVVSLSLCNNLDQVSYQEEIRGSYHTTCHDIAYVVG